MVDFEYKDSYNVYDLKRLIKALRSEGGCPWDREQTHESIRRNFLEEAYEAVEAIDEKNAEHLQEELGDVLLQVIFHAEMEEERGVFDLDAVADGTCKKLILRHPHVFGDVSVNGTCEVLENWDAIKRIEKNQGTVESAMQSIAKSLPALWRAEKVQKKAAKVGFDWKDAGGAFDKLLEEFEELKAARTPEEQAEEFGDLLFSVVNISRFLKIDPEDALHSACEKFISRFGKVERAAENDGRRLSDMTIAEMDKLWDYAKDI